MSADHPSGSEPKPQQPRLPRRLDEHLDPGVTLPEVPGDESPRPPIARPGSAEILDRLQDRGASKPRYRLDGELARGGMGAILKAYDEDLRRDLAMKVMLDGKGGSGATPDQVDERSLARFLEEAQVTGQLDHPGIVPVHELGLDDGGRVYFTMQLVRGRDLDSVLPEIDAGDGEWTLTRALGVVLRVCEAMAYAHERGVVHRDLKPGNVMVGRFGEVYVMDWGLARVAGHDDGRDLRVREADPADADDGSGQPASELRTMDGDVIGTPAYMAPEQARGEIDRVDARSDVYAVGAILYRLLTGSAPHMPRQGRRTTIEVLLAVRREPPEPIEQLRKGVPAELVAICDKAMARDPADRYQGMMALAADLRAYLEHRVVAAYETGAWAEARKWVRRNRAFAGALAVAATLLVAGLFVSLMLKQLADEQAALAEQRRESAARSADEARRQAGIATAVNSFLNDDMLAALAPEHDGVAVTVRDVLQQASASIAFRTDLEPEVEAALRLTIGTSFERLGEHRRAEPHLTRALALRRRELGDDAEPTLQAMRAVALCCEDLGRLAEAEELLQEMQTAARGLFGDDHRATLSATGDLVRVRAARAGRAIARADCEQLLAASERVLGAMHPDTITARNNLGVLLQARGDHDGAERSLVAALEARKAVHGSRHGSTIDSMLNLAVLRVAQGRFAAAERLQLEALAAKAEVFGADHVSYARARSTLGEIYLQQARFDEALEELRGAFESLRMRLGDDHPWTLLAGNNLASGLTSTGKLEEALVLSEDTLARQRRVLGEEHEETMLSMANLASLLNTLGRRDEAEQLGRATLALQTRVLGPDHPSTLTTRDNLGGALFGQDRFDESEQETAAALAGRRRALGDAHPAVARSLFNLAMVQKSQGKSEQAQASFTEALQLFETLLPAGHPAIGDCQYQLANLLSRAERWDEAEGLFRAALAVRRTHLQADADEVTVVMHNLGVMLLRKQDYAAAVRELRPAVALRLQRHGAGHRYPVLTSAVLGVALLRLGEHAEAEPLLLAYHRQLEADHGPEHAQTQTIVRRLCELYEAWGKEPEVAAWRGRLTDKKE